MGDAAWFAPRRGPPRRGRVRHVVERSLDLDIARLTLYAFSSDNWRRPASEVQSIFWVLRAFLRLETERLRRRGVRLRVIGRRDRLPKVVLCDIEKAESITAAGSCLSLCVAIDYSARDAITRAASEVNAFLSNEKPSSPDLFQPLLVQALTKGEGKWISKVPAPPWIWPNKCTLGFFSSTALSSSSHPRCASPGAVWSRIPNGDPWVMSTSRL
jgi:hypothetical protein